MNSDRYTPRQHSRTIAARTIMTTVCLRAPGGCSRTAARMPGSANDPECRHEASPPRRRQSTADTFRIVAARPPTACARRAHCRARYGGTLPIPGSSLAEMSFPVRVPRSRAAPTPRALRNTFPHDRGGDPPRNLRRPNARYPRWSIGRPLPRKGAPPITRACASRYIGTHPQGRVPASIPVVAGPLRSAAIAGDT